ncbi:hypothetical protein, partial [Xenorhabdus szentirmaii]|uniref:hypothetical protein n=1 Tax=Xenorhabdus szentirmaii TaxID=290112 RepID=UPI001996FE89
GAPATLWITGVSGTTPFLHDSVFCSREAPCGGCTGRRWRARERATQQREVRAARSQCSGVGAGEVKPEAAGRPAFRVVGRMQARRLKKNAVFCRGRAEKPTAEGAALCATPYGADERGPDIMCIIRIKPLCSG